MSQLRAKQIKLNAQHDLLVGGASGNGSVLSLGSADQVLKVTAGGALAYETLRASVVSTTAISGVAGGVDSNIQTVLAGLQANIEAAGTASSEALADLQESIDASLLNIDVEMNNIEASVGLKGDGTLNVWTSTNYISNGSPEDATDPENVIPAVPADTFKVAVQKLDAALFAADGAYKAADTAINTRIDNLTAADIAFTGFSQTTVGGALTNLDNRVAALTGLNALHFKGVVAGDAVETPEGAVQGDVFRITTTGATNFAGTGLEVNVGDFVAYAGTTNTGTEEEPVIEPVWVKFDNTDPAFALAGGETNLTLTGNAHAGYTFGLNKADVTSANTAIVVTGGEDAALAAVEVEFVPSAVSINDLSGVADVAHGGTGFASFAKGDLVIGNATSGLDKLAIGAEHQVLTVNADGTLEYGYISAIRNASGTVVASVVSDKLTAAAATIDEDAALAYTTKGWVESKFSGAAKTVAQEEFAGAAAVEGVVAYTLAQTALAGSIAVFINGLKLKASAFTVAGTALEIDVATVGYDLDASDLVAVEYQYNG